MSQFLKALEEAGLDLSRTDNPEADTETVEVDP